MSFNHELANKWARCSWKNASCITIVDVVWYCSRLARFAQRWCTQACALVRFSIPNMSRQSHWVAKRAQHVAPNNAAICCAEMLRSFGWSLQMLGQQCCDMLWWNVAIVWLGLKLLNRAEGVKKNIHSYIRIHLLRSLRRTFQVQ